MSDTTGWAIVAIPEEDDYVWKISSEKVPHMTLLFLGQQSQDDVKAMQIAEFIQHVASTSLPRFGLNVDYRGTLGPDDADVLFFSKDFTKQVANARSYLLKDETIFEMYNSTQQYPEWTPHLTLGYPTSPAKKIDRDYPITWVNFDRIALWNGDYTGPEFRLNSDDRMAVGDVAMSDNDFDTFLAHHGIKGMHWGVRRPEGSDGLVKRNADAAAKLVKNGEATKANPVHEKLKSIKTTSAMEKLLEKDAAENNPNGTIHFRNSRNNGDGTHTFELTTRLNTHVPLEVHDHLPNEYRYQTHTYTTKGQGKNDGYYTDPTPAKHSGDFDAFLAHYGIKGMHWGVRRSVGSDGLVEGGSSAPKHPDVVVGHNPHGRGGADGDPNTSADHERAAAALAKASTKGKESLSNEELNALTKRLQAEKQFRQLTEGEKSDIQKKIDQMKAEDEYNRMIAERNKRKQSAGRQIIGQLLTTTKDAAVQELGQKAGKEIANQLLGQFGVESAKPSKLKTPFSDIANKGKVKVTVHDPKTGKTSKGVGTVPKAKQKKTPTFKITTLK